MPIYNRTIVAAVKLDQLHSEVEASPSIAPTLNGITAAGTSYDFDFSASLSAGEETTLDGVIAAHVPGSSEPATDASAIEALATNGIVARTGSSTFATRSLVAGSSKVNISNADAVAGNPSVDAVEANFALNNIGGTLGVSKGGTGVTGTPTNGQLLIGNGTGFSLASLTAGTNITITPGAGTLEIASTGGGGGAPATAQYVTLALDGTLSAERVLTGTANQITITDGGANGNVTLSIGNNPILPGTESVTLPSGTTAQRPGSPINGMIRYNSTNNRAEIYQDSEWVAAAPENVGVRCATTANINLASAPTTIDGVTLAVGDRVLVKNQTTTSQNGIYLWNGAAVAMTRSSLMQAWQQVPGRMVMISEGTTNHTAFYWNDSAFTGTIGTTPITWSGDLRVGGRLDAGDSWTEARASSALGPRVVSLIDTAAVVRIWRFNTGATDPSIEFGYGTNDALDNAANAWWDMYLDGSADSFAVRRRTGGAPYSDKVWIAPNGSVAISGSATGWSGATPSVGLYLDHTDAIRVASGTTGQRPTAANGLVRFNTTEEVLEQSTALALPAGYTTWAGLQRSLLYRKRPWKVDDFVTGAVSTTGAGVYGELNWTVTSAGTAANSMITGVTDHPGILQLGSGATSGNNTNLHMGSTATTGIVIATQVEYFAFLVRFPTITTCTFTFGLMQDCNDPDNAGTAGVFFRFDPAVDNNLEFVTRSGSTSALAINGPIVASNTWYLCEAFYNGTSWIPVINGVEYTAQTTNIPTVALNVGMCCETNTTASRTLQVDYFAMYLRELGQRY